MEDKKEMMKIGLEQLEETPLFGIGLYNSALLSLYKLGRGTYLHNDYIKQQLYLFFLVLLNY